jgi:hypothetical protein
MAKQLRDGGRSVIKWAAGAAAGPVYYSRAFWFDHKLTWTSSDTSFELQLPRETVITLSEKTVIMFSDDLLSYWYSGI